MTSLLVGDDTGLIKRVQLKDGSSLQRLGFQGAGRAVHCMAWAGVGQAAAEGDGGDWEAREKEVVVGYKSGAVELYNTQSRELIAKFNALSLPPTAALREGAAAAAAAQFNPAVRAPKTINPTSSLVGLAVLQPRGAADSTSRTHERRLLTCSSGGVVHIRPFSTLSLDEEDEQMLDEEEEDAKPAAAAPAAKKGKGRAGKSSPALAPTPSPNGVAATPAAHVSATGATSFLVGSHICSLKVESRSQSLFAAGGKEHMLRLWDLATATPSWKEKNVGHDMLNLRQQVWITDLAFVAPSMGSEIVTGTAYHQVRAYDTRASKKALYSAEVSDHAITCVDVSADGKFIVVGDGGGRLQQLDRRMNARMVHVYRGIGGSVRGVQAHTSLPQLAAVGLDRFLRVYDVNTRAQLHKVYLKQKLNAVLFSAQTPREAAEAEEALAEAEALANAPAPDDDGDELWGELHKRAQRIKQEEGVEDAPGSGTGQYVKKRKAAPGDDDDEDVAEVPRSKKGKQAAAPAVQVKIEPVDDEPAAPAAAATKPRAAPRPAAPLSAAQAAAAQAARGRALQSSGLKDGQISFKQAIVYNEDDADDDNEQGEDEDDEDEEGGEDEEDEDMQEDGEDDEEGEDEEEEDEEEEEPEPTPAPKRGGRAAASTPAKKAAPAPAPSSTRSTRSRGAR